jgi:nitrate reductase gamma subunit
MVNTRTFGEALNQQELQTFQIMVGTLILGVLFFAGFVILFLTGMVDMVSENAPRFDHNMFAIIIVIATLAGMYASVIVPDRIMTSLFREASSTMRENPNDSLKKQINAIRTGMIIKFGLLEGVAFIGLAFNMMAAMDGYGLDSWRVWLNFLPSILLLLRARAEFPTRERILEIHRNYSQLV